MEQLIDQAVAVRAGEELDATAVDAFIKRHASGLDGAPEITQFPGGASNLTYLVRYANRDLILRRPPFGHRAKSAHDMAREARIMAALKPVYRYVPDVVAFCEDQSVMGCDFYVMDRIKGIIPRQNLPKGLALNEEDTRKLCLNVIDKMIELHQVDYKQAGLDHLGKGEGYVARQIDGWSERFRQARTEDVGDFEAVMAWLKAKQPAKDVATCLIHNDYRFDNVVLNPDNPFEVIGVLDWEMATLGDPLMDLGNTLAYWVQADDDPIFQQMRRQPTNAPGMLTRQEVIDYYGEKTGYHVDNFDFYAIYGLFRLAVIVQQIYRRYQEGQAKNPQFAMFGGIANYLEQRCQRLISQSTL
ncbi:phosphotransferase family protein [Chitinivorax sp. PXF-14]|uniref:phosphotransferase family protein n=1 Tax=Chitinivorax sp. PXF-14 TaxID=3230488 RepID=UPI0034650A8B